MSLEEIAKKEYQTIPFELPTHKRIRLYLQTIEDEQARKDMRYFLYITNARDTIPYNPMEVICRG